jgi:hypothetical protein
VLEQVSKNVFVMSIDFSEPTGEDYFKTNPEYDRLQTPDITISPPNKDVCQRKHKTPVITQVSKNCYEMTIDFTEPTGEKYFETDPEYDAL